VNLKSNANFSTSASRTIRMDNAVEKCFRIERHGAAALIVVLPEADDLPSHELYYAAPQLMASLAENPPTGLVVDLSQVKFFKSAFISFLLRCHMQTKKQGMGKMVVAAPTEEGRKLLHFMSLDKVWEIHSTTGKALRSVATGG
jgi:anti-sigma B factor antagonist